VQHIRDNHELVSISGDGQESASTWFSAEWDSGQRWSTMDGAQSKGCSLHSDGNDNPAER
jgi:hypothetical protein